MEPIWTKQYALTLSGNLFLFLAFYMLYPTLPLFIQHIGGTESHVGLSMGVFMLSAVFLRPLVGGLLDRSGRRPFIVSGLLLFAGAMYLYSWVGGLMVLLAVRVLHGFSWAFASTSLQTAVTDIVPPARRGEGMGWLGFSMTLAMAVGPMVGLWVLERQTYQTFFFFGAGLTLAALFVTAAVNIPYRRPTVPSRIEIFEPAVVPIVASSFFLFFAYAAITTFVPLFAHSIQVNSGIFFTVFAGALAVSRPLAGRLSDRRGEMFVLVPALVINASSLLLLSMTTSLTGFLASAILYGVGFGAAQPVFHAATIRLANPERRGAANASFTTAIDLGIGLGAMLLGWVSQQTSYPMLFLVSAVSVLMSLVLTVALVKPALERVAPAK